MPSDMSFTHLIASASLFAQFVLVALVLASILSWALIFSKRSLLRRLDNDANDFDEQFWSGGNLADLHEQTRRDEDLHGIASIFNAGYEEYTRQQTGVDSMPMTRLRQFSVKCASRRFARWSGPKMACRCLRPSARSARTSVCWAPCGAS